MLYHYEIADDRVVWDEICVNERDRFGTDHQEIGFYMALEWRLPEAYRQVIRLHHENGEGSRLAELVREANMVVRGKVENLTALALKKAAEEKTRRIMSLFAVSTD